MSNPQIFRFGRCFDHFGRDLPVLFGSKTLCISILRRKGWNMVATSFEALPVKDQIRSSVPFGKIGASPTSPLQRSHFNPNGMVVHCNEPKKRNWNIHCCCGWGHTRSEDQQVAKPGIQDHLNAQSHEVWPRAAFSDSHWGRVEGTALPF